MNILICGDQRWNNLKSISDCISKFNRDTDVILYRLEPIGALAKIAAENLGFNTRIASENELGHKVLAFHKFIRNSRNTMSIIRECEERRISYEIITD